MANHGYYVTMATGLCAQNAKTILGVVERDTFHKTGEHLQG
jgi:hypothetical protein